MIDEERRLGMMRSLWLRATVLENMYRGEADPVTIAEIMTGAADLLQWAREEMLHDLRAYPLFFALGQWVKPGRFALVNYEPKLLGIVESVVSTWEKKAASLQKRAALAPKAPSREEGAKVE